MSKRILAVGNGNELTEVTPYGVLLVHKWDARRGEYVAHTGDWASTDGVNARRGIRINKEPRIEEEYEEPYMHSYPGNGY